MWPRKFILSKKRLDNLVFYGYNNHYDKVFFKKHPNVKHWMGIHTKIRTKTQKQTKSKIMINTTIFLKKKKILYKTYFNQCFFNHNKKRFLWRN